jgi:LytR cell envelope-related transcriptional attenuator
MSLARVRALSIVGALVICAVILAIIAVTKDRQSSANYQNTCRADTIKVTTRPLPDEKNVKVNVYNGTGRPGLAKAVADELGNRKFQLGEVKDTNPYDKIAKLRYGPKALAAATVVNAYFLGEADDGSGYDPKDTTDFVDIVLGAQYRSLGTPTDVHQAIAQLGNPSPPAGTCDVSRG